MELLFMLSTILGSQVVNTLVAGKLITKVIALRLLLFLENGLCVISFVLHFNAILKKKTNEEGPIETDFYGFSH